MWTSALSYVRTHRLRTALLATAGVGAAVALVYARRMHRYLDALHAEERRRGVSRLRAGYAARCAAALEATRVLCPALQAAAAEVAVADAVALIRALREGEVDDKRLQWGRIRAAVFTRLVGAALLVSVAHAASLVGGALGGAPCYRRVLAARVCGAADAVLRLLATGAVRHAGWPLKTRLQQADASAACRAMVRDAVAAGALADIFARRGADDADTSAAMDATADLAAEAGFARAVGDAACDVCDVLLCRVDDAVWGGVLPTVLPPLHAVAAAALNDVPEVLASHDALHRLGATAFLSGEAAPTRTRTRGAAAQLT